MAASRISHAIDPYPISISVLLLVQYDDHGLQSGRGKLNVSGNTSILCHI
jgi:hypothetical protein